MTSSLHPALTPDPTIEHRARTVLLTTVSSDSHTWNLVFLQLLLEELGCAVVNLGSCVPDQLVLDECRRHQPDLVVVSTVNGHGHQDGKRLIGALRGEPDLSGLRVVIGGKLGVRGAADGQIDTALLAAGFDAVFHDQSALDGFRRYVLVAAADRAVAAERVPA